MDSLEHLQQQLDGVNDLRTIVRTMKALSAARIRQYEQAVAALSGYARTVQLGLHVVLRDAAAPLTTSRRRQEHERIGAVVFGSDHGLCGRFNEAITGFAREQLVAAGKAADAGPEPLLLAVGARAADSLTHAGMNVEADLMLPASPPQITATVQQLLFTIDHWRQHRQLHALFLFYNQHSTSRGYEPRSLSLLPLDLRQLHDAAGPRWPGPSLPIFTMARELLASRLLHQYLFVSLFRACAESQASEHAARLDAMQSAQRNVDEHLETLTMAYRRARQDTITAELLDVVSGFEAVSTQQ